MPFARASELDRLLACPGAKWLPNSGLVSESALTARNWGNFVHKWVETGEMHGDQSQIRLLEKKIRESGTTREEYWGAGRHEVALAYNVVTGRADICNGGTPEGKDDWKNAHDDEWIVGTLDYAEQLFDSIWVDDLKTGRRASWEAYAAQQTFYTATLGLGLYGRIGEARSSITHWPKYPVAARPFRTAKVLSQEYQEDFLGQLRELRTKILVRRQEDLRVTEHCTWCPARFDCPLKENDNGD